jgi:hypothetical protein
MKFTSAYLYAPPQDVGFRLWYSTEANGCFWPSRAGAMQDPANGLPRIPLPRTTVNKSIKAGVLKSRISHCFVANSLRIHRCMFSWGGL